MGLPPDESRDRSMFKYVYLVLMMKNVFWFFSGQLLKTKNICHEVKQNVFGKSSHLDQINIYTYSYEKLYSKDGMSHQSKMF